MNRRQKQLTPTENGQRLDSIGLVWNLFEGWWKNGFAALVVFKAREGHCRVPREHIEGTFKLGTWVAAQRKYRDFLKKRAMPAERRQRLDAIGFVWDPLEAAWDEGFAALMAFKMRERHFRVPECHIEGSFKLGNWVSIQRSTKDFMTSDHRQRLDEIGFVWDPPGLNWDKGFAALAEFKAREGHCRVPRDHFEGTVKLGKWVSGQRRRKTTMPAERKQQLDAIGFIWSRRPM